MKVELKTQFSTPEPDDVAIMAARGDYSETSMVGATVEDALEGASVDLDKLKDVASEEYYEPQTIESMYDEDGAEAFDDELILEAKKRTLIKHLLNSGHFGPFEHAQAYFAVEGISRTAMAQVTRHRHMSFDVQSQRYCDFSDKETVIPPGDKQNPAAEDIEFGENRWSVSGDDAMKDHFQASVDLYEQLRGEGMAKEDARMVLPVGTKVDLTFSANNRSLMHFLDLRDNAKAQWEAREFAKKVLAECEEWAPMTFEGYSNHLNNNSLRAP